MTSIDRDQSRRSIFRNWLWWSPQAELTADWANDAVFLVSAAITSKLISYRVGLKLSWLKLLRTTRLRMKSLEELNVWLLDKCIVYAKAHRHPEQTERMIWRGVRGGTR